MAYSKGSPQLIERKTYEFNLRGTKYILEEDEARTLKQLFINTIPDNGITPKTVDNNKVAKQLFPSIFNDKVRVIIPDGFREFDRSTTEQRGGHPPNNFIYYRNQDGYYGFTILNQPKHGFCRLGNIGDPHSIIGRCVRAVPINKPFGRGDIKKWGIVSSSEYRKAVCDILKLTGYFADSRQLGNRPVRFLYVRTNKIDGLEVDNNHGFPKEVETVLQPNK